MAEKCPLGNGLYWKNETEINLGIPGVCLLQCGKLIDQASDQASVGMDVFVDPETLAASDVEYGDTSLQRGQGAGRLVAILNVDYDGADLYSEEFPPFDCPND